MQRFVKRRTLGAHHTKISKGGHHPPEHCTKVSNLESYLAQNRVPCLAERGHWRTNLKGLGDEVRGAEQWSVDGRGIVKGPQMVVVC